MAVAQPLTVLQEEWRSLSDEAVIRRFDETTVRLDVCLAECPEPVTGTWSRRCMNLAWERFLLSHELVDRCRAAD